MSTKSIAELGVAHFKGLSVKEKGAHGNYVLVPSGAVFPEQIKFDRCKRFTDDAAKLAKKFLQANDVLFNSGGVGTLGRSHHIAEIEPKIYVPDSFVLVLRTNGEQLLSKYLYYYLQSPVAQQLIRDNTRGTIGITSIKPEAVLGFPISCPSLAEQQRIVRLLDEAFEGIAIAKANAEKNLQNAHELFESHLNSVFTNNVDEWNSNPLGELTDPNTPITYGVVKPGDEGEITFIRGGDLVGGKVRLDQLRTISRAVSNQYSRTLLRGGELLICLVGQPGQVAVAPKELAGANIARQVGLIRLKEGIDADFAKYFLQSAPGVQALGARESGSVQQVINLSELKLVSLVHPDLAQQRKVVARLTTIESEVNSLANLYAQKRLQWEALKQSLLHQAFSGRLKTA